MIANCQFPIVDCRLSNVECRMDPALSPCGERGDSLRAFVPEPGLEGCLRAFTLVEMVIVVAVILLIVGIVLPAASTLWRERRVAEAQNTISGMLMTARARAMQDNFGDSGLFFYVDDAGVQRIVAITQDAKKAADPATREAWANVFNVTTERSYALPAPMRVVPRYVVCDKSADGKSTCDENRTDAPKPYEVFSSEELANNDFNTLPSGADQAQRHRNFFTMIYSSSGQLRVRRDVLIRDADSDGPDSDGKQYGDVAGLEVRDDVKLYYGLDNSKVPVPLNPDASKIDIDVVTDSQGIVLNFPSVDGLLVYDESLFGAAGDDKRKYLMDYAQPFYVHRLTGAVVRGPVGENQAPTTP
jgi:Tfp pilus assembly protein FimT